MRHAEVTLVFSGADAEVFHAARDLFDMIGALDSRFPGLIKGVDFDFTEVTE